MSFDIFLGAAVEAQVNAGANDKDIQAMISDIIGIFKNPIILYPGGWEDTLPPRMYEEITMQRFVQQMKAKGKPIEESTDAEALAYLYSAVLVAPMSHEWANIYVWLGRDLVPEGDRKGMGVPAKLTQGEQKMLDDLKRWIHRRQHAARGKVHFIHPGMKKKKKAKIGCGECPVIVEAEY